MGEIGLKIENLNVGSFPRNGNLLSAFFTRKGVTIPIMTESNVTMNKLTAATQSNFTLTTEEQHKKRGAEDES